MVDPAILARLYRTKGFVFDMDGTLVLGDQRNHGLRPLPGAVEMIRHLGRHDIPFTIFTNGTTRPPKDYVHSLRQAGFELPDDCLLTPVSSAITLFLRRRYKRVMVLGGDGVTGPLRDVGIEPVTPQKDEKVDAVFVAWYRDFTMESLEAAVHAVWSGAKLFSASQALFFATEEGKALGTSRAISVMIKDLTGARIQLVGKPSLEAVRCAGRKLRLAPPEMAVVGDDPLLEVPMAHRGRALAISVATGLAGHDAFDHLPAAERPHLNLRGVDELLQLIEARP